MSDSGLTTENGINPVLPEQSGIGISSVLTSIAEPVNEVLEWFGSLGIFSWKVLLAALTPPYEWRELNSCIALASASIERLLCWLSANSSAGKIDEI
jgi:hypothetical protein